MNISLNFNRATYKLPGTMVLERFTRRGYIPINLIIIPPTRKTGEGEREEQGWWTRRGVGDGGGRNG